MQRNGRSILLILVAVVALASVGFVLFSWQQVMAPTTTVDEIAQVDGIGEQEEVHDEPFSQDTNIVVTFTLNTQDFSYPEKSAETMTRILDLHEQYQIPITVYLTTTMVDYYSQEQPALFARVLDSPLVSLGYHVRPPFPYHPSTLHGLDLSTLSIVELQDLVREYETHGLDLETGETTDTFGGFAKLVSLAGERVYSVGVVTENRLLPVLDVYADLGATFIAGHTGDMVLGDKTGALWTRPEQVDIKAFERTDEDPATVLQEAIDQVRDDVVPAFVNVKMHDNNFFAEQSAWTSVYLSEEARRLGPPYNLTNVSALLTDDQSEAVWSFYKSLLQAASKRQDVSFMTVEDVFQLEQQ